MSARRHLVAVAVAASLLQAMPVRADETKAGRSQALIEACLATLGR